MSQLIITTYNLFILPTAPEYLPFSGTVLSNKETEMIQIQYLRKLRVFVEQQVGGRILEEKNINFNSANTM